MENAIPEVKAAPHVPFDNPELEAYWNRPCRHRKYPYPDENVFLVSGARFQGEHFESVAESSIIVSLTPELAQSYYVDIADDSHLKVVSCLSLVEAKALKNRMAQASAQDDCVQIKPSLMNALFFKSDLFWVVGKNAQGLTLEKAVQAKSMREVLMWAAETKIQILGIIAESALDETLEDMEKVQQGTGVDQEAYASDYVNAEDLLESDVRIASRSIEEKDKSDEGFLRSCKKDKTCSKDEYEQLVIAFANAKEKRHHKVA